MRLQATYEFLISLGKRIIFQEAFCFYLSILSEYPLFNLGSTLLIFASPHTFNLHCFVNVFSLKTLRTFYKKKHPTRRKSNNESALNTRFLKTEKWWKQDKRSEDNSRLHWNCCDNKRDSSSRLFGKERTSTNRRTNNNVDFRQTIGTKTTVVSMFQCYTVSLFQSFIDLFSFNKIIFSFCLVGSSARVSVLDRLDQLPVNEGTKNFAILCMVHITKHNLHQSIRWAVKIQILWSFPDHVCVECDEWKLFYEGLFCGLESTKIHSVWCWIRYRIVASTSAFVIPLPLFFILHFFSFSLIHIIFLNFVMNEWLGNDHLVYWDVLSDKLESAS
jgi:hypothetical protein